MTEIEALNRFREFLDEVYEDIDICGYVYAPSFALKTIDPIAFNEAFNWWVDVEGIEVEWL